MREILFRGKRCDNGEWVEGYYIRAVHHWHKHGIHEDWIACGASANGGWFALHNKYPVKCETVGQYTGLTDKNGKKIFEGDIITSHNGEIFGVAFGQHWDVEYESAAYGWFAFHGKDELSFGEDWGGHEVIGNIHDNPELLGGEENADSQC